jgi:hypothetical protein
VVPLQEVKKKNDAFSRRSAQSFKREMARHLTRIFVQSLECVEIRFGREFDGYDEIRAKILRVGNNAKREVERIVDEQYNVEKVPHVTVVNTKGRQTEREEEND